MKTVVGKARISKAAKALLSSPDGAEQLVSAVLEASAGESSAVRIKAQNNRVVDVSTRSSAARTAAD